MGPSPPAFFMHADRPRALQSMVSTVPRSHTVTALPAQAAFVIAQSLATGTHVGAPLTMAHMDATCVQSSRTSSPTRQVTRTSPSQRAPAHGGPDGKQPVRVLLLRQVALRIEESAQSRR